MGYTDGRVSIEMEQYFYVVGTQRAASAAPATPTTPAAEPSVSLHASVTDETPGMHMLKYRDGMLLIAHREPRIDMRPLLQKVRRVLTTSSDVPLLLDQIKLTAKKYLETARYLDGCNVFVKSDDMYMVDEPVARPQAGGKSHQ